MKPEMSTTSSEFFLNLYIHNLRAAAKLSTDKEKAIAGVDITKRSKTRSESRNAQKTHLPMETKQSGSISDWMTAAAAYEHKIRSGKKQSSHISASLLKPDKDTKNEEDI